MYSVLKKWVAVNQCNLADWKVMTQCLLYLKKIFE